MRRVVRVASLSEMIIGDFNYQARSSLGHRFGPSAYPLSKSLPFDPLTLA